MRRIAGASLHGSSGHLEAQPGVFILRVGTASYWVDELGMDLMGHGFVLSEGAWGWDPEGEEREQEAGNGQVSDYEL